MALCILFHMSLLLFMRLKFIIATLTNSTGTVAADMRGRHFDYVHSHSAALPAVSTGIPEAVCPHYIIQQRHFT